MKTKWIQSAIVVILFLLFAAGLIFISAIEKQPRPQTIQKTNQSPPLQASASSAKDEVLKNALNLYVKKKQEGVDFSNGPCLGKVADDWVLDIAHNPRQPVDDKPENQCEDFRLGRVHHFIELDPDGKLIRSQ